MDQKKRSNILVNVGFYIIMLYQSSKEKVVFLLHTNARWLVYQTPCRPSLHLNPYKLRDLIKFSNDTEVSSIQNIRLYSYKELRIASNDFSVVNKIGRGGFGSVYKVRLYWFL